MELAEAGLYLQSILWGVLNLIVIIICSILVYKKKSTAFIIMLIGSILTLIFQIINPIVMVFFYNSVTEIMTLNAIIGFLSIISYLTFVIGLGMFALKFPKRAS